MTDALYKNQRDICRQQAYLSESMAVCSLDEGASNHGVTNALGSVDKSVKTSAGN